MAGRGPAPKDPQRLAGHGAAKARAGQMRVVEVKPSRQPTLRRLLGEVNPLTGGPWRESTLLFWRQLGSFPTTSALLPAQWSSLARAVAYDEAALLGRGKVSPSEARLRLAKFGVDPDDLMRLRVQVVAADEAEARRQKPSPQASYGNLRAVGD